MKWTQDRLDLADARHREMYGSGQLRWVAAMAAYERTDDSADGILAGCSIVGADRDELQGDAAAAARELEMVRRLSKCDPSFELSRHTMMVLGRPVQVIPVMLLSSHPFPSFRLLLKVCGNSWKLKRRGFCSDIVWVEEVRTRMCWLWID